MVSRGAGGVARARDMLHLHGPERSQAFVKLRYRSSEADDLVSINGYLKKVRCEEEVM